MGIRILPYHRPVGAPAPAAEDPRAEHEIRFVCSVLCLTAALLIAGLLHATSTAATLVVVVVGVGTTLRQPVVARAGVALVGWAMVTGFFVNSGGRLALDTTDLVRLSLVGTALLVLPLLVGRRHR